MKIFNEINLCIDLIILLRSFLYLRYEGNDSANLSVKMPTSLNFEIFIFDFALRLLIEMNNTLEFFFFELQY